MYSKVIPSSFNCECTSFYFTKNLLLFKYQFTLPFYNIWLLFTLWSCTGDKANQGEFSSAHNVFDFSKIFEIFCMKRVSLNWNGQIFFKIYLIFGWIYNRYMNDNLLFLYCSSSCFVTTFPRSKLVAFEVFIQISFSISKRVMGRIFFFFFNAKTVHQGLSLWSLFLCSFTF